MTDHNPDRNPSSHASRLADLDELVLWDSVVQQLSGHTEAERKRDDPVEPGCPQRQSTTAEVDLVRGVFAHYGVLLGQLQQVEGAVLLMLRCATQPSDVRGEHVRVLGRLSRTERCPLLADLVWEKGKAGSLGPMLEVLFEASAAHTLLATGIADSTTDREGQLESVVLHHPDLEHGLESLDTVITINEAIGATVAAGVVASELGLLGLGLGDDS